EPVPSTWPLGESSTAPTQGLGEVRAMPRRASSSGWRMKRSWFASDRRDLPQGLKTTFMKVLYGTAEAVPLQRKPKPCPFKEKRSHGPSKRVQNHYASGCGQSKQRVYSNNESTKSWALKGSRSAAFSPTPT